MSEIPDMAEILSLQNHMKGAPDPARDQKDAEGQVSLESEAKEAFEFHQKGLRARRRRDLTAEKLAMHLDGSGLAQWYDVYQGQRLTIPPNLHGGPRQQNNQMRPATDNMVAHLTTKEYRVVARAKLDREARERARIDQALINHQIRSQQWNAQMAAMKYIGAAYGSCPWHAFWRDLPDDDQYEAIGGEGDPMAQMMGGPRRGMIDSWIGNPWATVYNAGATRWARTRQTYERVLPADLVRMAFQRFDLEGTTKMASASVYHRMGAAWERSSGSVHGIGWSTGGLGNQELISLIYDEIAPGTDPRFPRGRLAIYAIQGDTSAQDVAAREGSGKLTPLWTGPLPAGTFSSIIVYSHFGRMDDVLGKPYLEDLDDLQIEINQLETIIASYIGRANDAPLITTGHLNEDTLDYSGQTVLELDPLGPGVNPEAQHLRFPGDHLATTEKKLQRALDAFYRTAGWQAASRGEVNDQSGKAIIALQTADDSIFGPLTMQTRKEIEDYSRLNWKLFREYGDAPYMIDLAGDEIAHLAEPFVTRDMVSDSAPQFTVTSGFGVNPEAEAQQLINLAQVRDWRGEGVLTAREIKRLWPDQNIFDDREDPDTARQRRPRVINAMIRDYAAVYADEYQGAPNEMGNPQTVQLAQLIAMEVDQAEPALMDDDLEAHIDELSIITQDTTETPLARHAAMLRQKQYYAWAAQRAAAQAMQQQPQGGGKPAAGGSGQGGQPSVTPKGEGGTSTSEAMLQKDAQASRKESA